MKTMSFQKKKAKIAEEKLRRQLLKGDKYELFHGQTFYVHNSVGENAKIYVQALLKMHAASLSTVLNKSVSYIVADKFVLIVNFFFLIECFPFNLQFKSFFTISNFSRPRTS